MTEREWAEFRRGDGTIDLELLCRTKYGGINTRQREAIAMIENTQRINSRQAAAVVVGLFIHLGREHP